MVEYQPLQWTIQLLGFEWLPKPKKMPFEYKYPSRFKDIKIQLFISHHFHRLDERQEESRAITRLQANRHKLNHDGKVTSPRISRRNFTPGLLNSHS